mgnify:CR=1 FL=1
MKLIPSLVLVVLATVVAPASAQGSAPDAAPAPAAETISVDPKSRDHEIEARLEAQLHVEVSTAVMAQRAAKAPWGLACQHRLQVARLCPSAEQQLDRQAVQASMLVAKEPMRELVGVAHAMIASDQQDWIALLNRRHRILFGVHFSHLGAHGVQPSFQVARL